MTNTPLTEGKSYLYLVRAYDAAGNRSADGNYDLATTMDFTDSQLTATTMVRAKHIIEVRAAVNAICTYAGASLCPLLPFTGAALDETEVKKQAIKASDFIDARNQIASLRSMIGASAATFRETPTVEMTVRIIHMEDLRAGVN